MTTDLNTSKLRGNIMKKHFYINLTEHENTTFDQILCNAGLPGHTDYFTALAKATIYGIDAINWTQKIRQLGTTKTRRYLEEKE